MPTWRPSIRNAFCLVEPTARPQPANNLRAESTAGREIGRSRVWSVPLAAERRRPGPILLRLWVCVAPGPVPATARGRCAGSCRRRPPSPSCRPGPSRTRRPPCGVRQGRTCGSLPAGDEVLPRYACRGGEGVCPVRRPDMAARMSSTNSRARWLANLPTAPGQRPARRCRTRRPSPRSDGQAGPDRRRSAAGSPVVCRPERRVRRPGVPRRSRRRRSWARRCCGLARSRRRSGLERVVQMCMVGSPR